MDRTTSVERRELGRRRTRSLTAGLATVAVAGGLAVAGYTASTAASTDAASSTTTTTTSSGTTTTSNSVSSSAGVPAATSGGS